MSTDTRPVQIAMAQVEAPKSTQASFELPCGYLDPEGKLHTQVDVREMTGAEEDMFGSRNLNSFQKFSELLARCTVRIGTVSDPNTIRTVVRKLPIGDRLFILFAIRRVTLGNEFAFNEKCPECNRESLFKIDLSELDEKKMPDPMTRIYDRKLPSGRIARFRVSTGEDEDRISKFQKSEDALSQGILMRLELLDGLPPTLEAVKAMGWKDRQALRKEWDKVEGGVDTEVEMTCSLCSHEFKRDIQVSSSFFSLLE